MTEEFIVSTLEDENDGDFSQGDLSLREAIALANDTEGADTITFDSSLDSGTITLIKDQSTGRPTLANTPLIITDSVTISGLGADNLTIDGDNGGSGIFDIDSGDREIDVIVEDVTIANGAQLSFSFPGLTDFGGSFYVSDNANFQLKDSVITGSSASIGGAIYNRGKTDIVNSTIENSSSTGDGTTPRPSRTDAVIVNRNELTVLDSNIQDNSGTAIFNIGTLEVNNTAIVNNTTTYAGGAIDNRNEATIVGSNISGNTAPKGSAIRNTGNLSDRYGNTLSIYDSVIQGNTSSSSDNSVIATEGTTSIVNSTIADHNGGSNVGILVESGTLEVKNSTISNNQADQAQSGIIVSPETTANISNSTIANNEARSNAGIENFGTVNLSNSTIANNTGGLGGGGLRNFGTANVTSTIVANNTSPGLGDVSGDGEFISGGNNLIGDAIEVEGLSDSDITNVDPQSGELQDNGGATETIALLDSSPAIDAGSNPNNLATDQRGEGFDRTVGDATDIGAFEVQNDGSGDGELVVSTLDDENDGDFSAGDLSLREAIALANEQEGADTITFDSALSGGTIAIDESLNRDLTISDSVTINGLGQDNLTLDGGFVFDLPESDVQLTISGLNLVGSAVDSFGDLNIINTTISQSVSVGSSSSDNSSIISRGSLNLSGSNVIDSSGGDNLGILIESGTAEISNSTIANHEGVLGGSGLLILTDETVNVTNSTIANNNNRFVGGVANAGGGEVNITNSTITNNNGGLGSGGIQNSSGTVTVTSTIVAGNSGGIGIGDVARDGEYISGGNNLIGNGDDALGFVDGVNGDIVGTNGDDINNPEDGLIDPLLGELQNNGGSTLTFALLDDSPAIDAGSNPNDLATDQRGEGFDRTVGDATDIGAFEVQDPNQPGEEDDVFDGTDDNDSFNGSRGDDLIFGQGGDDTLVGGSDNDTISGDEGNDRIAGGAGDDSLSGNNGNDTVLGGKGNDTLLGGDGHDSLIGGKDSDLLLGGAGNDTLTGGGQNDIINGDEGDDLISGGGGRDTLIGGAGQDTLSGNGGTDVFVLTAGDLADTITDFEDGRDRLVLPDSLSFDSLIIVNNDSNSGASILDSTNHDAVLVSIENVHAADIDGHDFIVLDL